MISNTITSHIIIGSIQILQSWPCKRQGGRGHWAVYYTRPRKFYNNVYLFVQQLWELLLCLIGLSIKLIFKTFKSIIVIYRRGNFMYHYWGCTSIYQSSSYPFKSLFIRTFHWKRICWIPMFSLLRKRTFNVYFNIQMIKLKVVYAFCVFLFMLSLAKKNFKDYFIKITFFTNISKKELVV